MRIRPSRLVLLALCFVGSSPAAISQTPSTTVVGLRFESRVPDVSADELRTFALATLNDERGWTRAGIGFEADPAAPYLVVLAEPAATDRLCLPLRTVGRYSCQNGPTVALNAQRWRTAISGWSATLDDYRRYMVNHEVGHLFGQRHPASRCPISGGRAAVMEQQSKGLEGCRPNAWPLDWEITLAARRPLKMAPDPNWQPENPTNLGDTTDQSADIQPTTQTTPEAATSVATSSRPEPETTEARTTSPTTSLGLAISPGVAHDLDGESSSGPSLPIAGGIVVGIATVVAFARRAVRVRMRRRRLAAERRVAAALRDKTSSLSRQAEARPSSPRSGTPRDTPGTKMDP